MLSMSDKGAVLDCYHDISCHISTPTFFDTCTLLLLDPAIARV